MNKKLFLILIILSFSFSCGNSKEQEQTTKKNKITEVKEGRYGSELVGYVTKPEEWKYFYDKDASPNAKQLSLTPFDIVTLDIVSSNNQATAEELRDRSYEGYINERGVPKENIIKKDIVVNNFKGKGFTIKIPDGRILIVNYIENDGNIYHISQEGLPKYQEELKKIVDTWLPDK